MASNNITKADIKTVVDKEINSKEFENKIRKIVTDSFNEFIRLLYQNRNYFKLR